MVAAKIANLRQGRKPAKLPLCPEDAPVEQSAAAGLLNVSERTVRAAVAVQRDATPNIVSAIELGEVAVSAAVSRAGRKGNLHVRRAVASMGSDHDDIDRVALEIIKRFGTAAAQTACELADIADTLPDMLSAGSWQDIAAAIKRLSLKP